MKKVLLFVAILAAGSFASCKKDRTCTCLSSLPGSTSRVVVYTKAKKGDARAACLSYTDTYVDYSTGSPVSSSETVTCTLK